MKQKLLHKYLIAGVISLSLFSFAYVNLHAEYNTNTCCQEQSSTNRPALVEEEDDQSGNIAVPDVTYINRVAKIVQRFISTNQ
ncbi:MAG: hypothetical protein EP344_00260 [Bacteroidetes bacterium]|nr:MAG: hypothetical protein EP344_00260 [Bacteroidota bacterium]